MYVLFGVLPVLLPLLQRLGLEAHHHPLFGKPYKLFAGSKAEISSKQPSTVHKPASFTAAKRVKLGKGGVALVHKEETSLKSQK